MIILLSIKEKIIEGFLKYIMLFYMKYENKIFSMS